MLLGAFVGSVLFGAVSALWGVCVTAVVGVAVSLAVIALDDAVALIISLRYVYCEVKEGASFDELISCCCGVEAHNE